MLRKRQRMEACNELDLYVFADWDDSLNSKLELFDESLWVNDRGNTSSQLQKDTVMQCEAKENLSKTTS